MSLNKNSKFRATLQGEGQVRKNFSNNKAALKPHIELLKFSLVGILKERTNTT